MTREKERITFILNAISDKRKQLVHELQKIPSVVEVLIHLKYLPNIFEKRHNKKISIREILEYWMENESLRLTQVLVNLSIIPNIRGTWYYKDEVQWAINSDLVNARYLTYIELSTYKNNNWESECIRLDKISEEDLYDIVRLLKPDIKLLVLNELIYRIENEKT